MLEYCLYNPIEDKFPPLFEKVVLGSLKSFFQLDHQVDASLYLMEATHTPPLWRFSWFETILMHFQSH